MVHVFQTLGNMFALDVESGSIMEIDSLAYALLALDETAVVSEQTALEALSQRYDSEAIIQTLQEITALADEGILYSPPIIAKELTMLQRNNGIKALCLNVAHDCNLRCRYCFASEGNYHMDKSLMDIETAQKAIDLLLRNSGKRKNVEVDFFGGEPLLNMAVIKRTVDYAKKAEKQYGKTVHFTVTTNAMLLDEETRIYLNENMDNVVLSLDGRREVHDAMRPDRAGNGSYDRIVNHIQRFVAMRGDKAYFVRGTFTSENLDFGKDILHLHSLGFNEISLEPAVGEGEAFHLKQEDVPQIKEEYESFAREYLALKQNGSPLRFYHFNINLYNGPCLQRRITACAAGNEYFAVSPDGGLYPCHQFVGIDAFRVGDVNQGIADHALCEKMCGINVFTKEACSRCWAKYFCSGGCHANAWFSSNDMKIPNAIACELQKKRVECAIGINALMKAECGEEQK